MHLLSLKAAPFCFSIKLITILLTFILSYLPTLCHSRLGSQCHGPSLGVVICYVRCFHEIGSLVKNKDDVTDMIIYASGTQCDFVRAELMFSQFANTKRLHFTGLQCPFGQLSSVRQVQLHFIRSQERIIRDVNFLTRKPQFIHLSNLTTLEVIDICCGLLTGYAEAPLLQNLTILCPDLQLEIDGTPDAIPILDDKAGLLHIQAPLLRRVEIQESSISFFPTASVTNLPALHSLFIKSCEFCRQTPKSIPPSSNLPALSALVSYRESPSLLPMSLLLKTVCAQMGSSQLHFVRLLNPPASGMRCPSLWHCDACGLSESEADIVYKGLVSTNRSNSLTFLAPFQLGNDHELYPNPALAGSRRQTVEIFLRSPSETPLSTFLPAVAALNTTDLELSHSPVLIIEGKVFTRLPHLRRLEVKQMPGGIPDSGLTRLSGNPFKGLPHPEKLRILRLSLDVCSCGQYRAFKWLDERAEKLRAGLRCHRVLDLNRTDLGTVENKWMSQSEFISLWAPFCEEADGAPTVVPMTLEAVAAKRRNCGSNLTPLDWTYILALISVVFVNKIYPF